MDLREPPCAPCLRGEKKSHDPSCPLSPATEALPLTQLCCCHCGCGRRRVVNRVGVIDRPAQCGVFVRSFLYYPDAIVFFINNTKGDQHVCHHWSDGQYRDGYRAAPAEERSKGPGHGQKRRPFEAFGQTGSRTL